MSKNKYERESAKKGILGSLTQEQNTKGNITGSGIETAKDLLFGVVGGGVAGAIAGRFSLLAGAIVTGIGHFKKSRLATSLGIGMMASGTLKATQTVSGVDGLEGAKERVMSLKDGLTEKLFLDKILKKKTAEATNGMGDVQYFLPGNEARLEGDLDLSALDRIERQVTASAEQYKQVNGMGSLEGEMGDLDPQNNY